MQGNLVAPSKLISGAYPMLLNFAGNREATPAKLRFLGYKPLKT